MSWVIKNILILFTMLLLSAGIYSYKKVTITKPASIVCTTTILADACKSLIGDQVKVISLMGPGIDPHLYQARPSDVYNLKNAKVLVYHGLHLEGKITSLLEGLAHSHIVIDASKGCANDQLRPAENMQLYDPHIWHDVTLWIQVINYISETLITAFPDLAINIQENTVRYIKQLEELDREITDLMNLIPKNKRTLITAHDAFWYFGKRYGLEVIGLQGLSTDAGISVQDIEKIAHLIVTKNIPTIFVETSITERSLKAVQQAVIGLDSTVEFGKELYSDALGTPSQRADTYISMMHHNSKAIAEGLMR